ncbi:hypothetical protein DVS77_27790 [Mycolicibacterium moriokaense]|nr:hypothetical protein DVS77_27790 [Mycolicibacterium moriokaense]
MRATESLQVDDGGRILTFTIDDVMRYHGPHSPAGVAIAFKAMQRAFDHLSPGVPPPRRSVVVRTAFRGPGARDGFEAVTRAVTEGHYTVDRSLVRGDRGRLLEDFVFEVGVGGRVATLLLRDGFVTDEFIDLARAEDRTADQERHLDDLKADLARRVMATAADELFDLA